jgi:hypothetical protein
MYIYLYTYIYIYIYTYVYIYIHIYIYIYIGRTSPEYAILFQIIPFPRTMPENTVDVITRFLDVNEVTRLGAGNTGVSDIKKHPYFANIDWELLEQKHVEPPFKPVYLCIFIYRFMYIYMYIFICIYICISIYEYLYIHIYMYIFICIYIYISIHVYLYIHIYIYVCTNIHKHLYLYRSQKTVLRMTHTDSPHLISCLLVWVRLNGT